MTVRPTEQSAKTRQAAPGSVPGRWTRFVRYQRAVWRLALRRLGEHNVTAMSASLSYRTIFALIPVLILALLVAKSLGTLEDAKHSLRSFLEASGFAQIVVAQDAGEATTRADAPPAAPGRKVINVAEEIEKVVAQVEGKLTFARIGPIGGLLLIWTAVGLLGNIEQSLNRIFGASRGRALVRRLLLYWSVLTLSPIVLAAASYLGEKTVETFGQASGLAWLLVACGRLAPPIIFVLVLAAVYKLLPNTQVRFVSAIAGATVAAVLWLVAKWGFALYVERLVLKGNLYGMLGAVPLFMLWLYYSWLTFLIGAELAHTAVHVTELDSAQRAARTALGPSDLLAAAVAVAQPFAAGRGPVPFDEIVARLKLPGASVQWLLDRLVSRGLVCTVEDSNTTRYLPARPVGQISVCEVLELADPRPGATPSESYDPEIANVVAQVQSRTRSSLGALMLDDVLCGRAGPSQVT